MYIRSPFSNSLVLMYIDRKKGNRLKVCLSPSGVSLEGCDKVFIWKRTEPNHQLSSCHCFCNGRVSLALECPHRQYLSPRK